MLNLVKYSIFGSLMLSVISCNNRSINSNPKDVQDIFSMTVREDGNYDVICKSGVREVASADQIASRKVCGSIVNESRECKELKKMKNLVSLTSGFESLNKDIDQLYKFACEIGSSRYPNGNAVKSSRQEWVNEFDRDSYQKNFYTWYYESGKIAYYEDLEWRVIRPGHSREDLVVEWTYPNGKAAMNQDIEWNNDGNSQRIDTNWFYPNGNQF